MYTSIAKLCTLFKLLTPRKCLNTQKNIIEDSSEDCLSNYSINNYDYNCVDGFSSDQNSI